MNDALRVLIAEDEPLVSMMLEEILTDLGVNVTSVAATLPDAIAAVEKGNIDCALLDMNLQGERADPVAACLAERSTPFAILSGGETEAEQLGAVVFVPKPYRFADIERTMDAIRQEIDKRGNRLGT
ncbi:MAG: response regulator [Alteraurantiacibacter sp.]